MPFTPRLFLVVGTPGSGKDLLIRAVNDLGVQHARIVPKHTTRMRRSDDGNEMICREDEGFDLDACDVVYANFGETYGVESSKIWDGLRHGVFQVLVVSNAEAINKLRRIFGQFVVLAYVHSGVDAEMYRSSESSENRDSEYVRKRLAGYRSAYMIYLGNLLAFDHVLLNYGAPEDLFDQIFRLFRAYERSYL